MLNSKISHLIDLELLNNLSNSQCEAKLEAIEELLNNDSVDNNLRSLYIYQKFFLAHKADFADFVGGISTATRLNSFGKGGDIEINTDSLKILVIMKINLKKLKNLLELSKSTVYRNPLYL